MDFKILAVDQNGEVSEVNDNTIGDFMQPLIMVAVPGRMSRATVAKFLHQLATDIGMKGVVH